MNQICRLIISVVAMFFLALIIVLRFCPMLTLEKLEKGYMGTLCYFKKCNFYCDKIYII